MCCFVIVKVNFTLGFIIIINIIIRRCSVMIIAISVTSVLFYIVLFYSVTLVCFIVVMYLKLYYIFSIISILLFFAC